MLPALRQRKLDNPIWRSVAIVRRLIIISVFLSSVALAQDQTLLEPDLEEAGARVARWDNRVKELIRISENSAAKLPEAEQALYLALLAKLTWTRDERAARGYMARAANVVLSQLSETRPGERRRQADFAVKALSLLFELDGPYATELVARLNRDLDDDSRGPVTRDRELAELYITIAGKVARANPQLAFSYGNRSLRYGFATGLPRLAVDIHSSDGGLAEQLVANAVMAARGTYTDEAYVLAFNLNRNLAETGNSRQFSLSIRKRAAELFIELLTGAAQVESERPRRCGIAFYAPTVAPIIAELLPERVQSFDQNFRLCLPYLSGLDKQTTAVKGDGVPESIDDILKAARDTPDKELKLWLYREALYRLMNAKEFQRMLSILDGFDGDEYEKYAPIAWGNWRVRAAFGAALAALETGDLPGTARHIDQTPARLRPFVREKLVRTEWVRDDRGLLIETLNGMQKDLASIEIPAHDAASLYLALAQHYLRAVPSESERMFSKAVYHINRFDSETEKKPTDNDWIPPLEHYVEIDAGILEVDEYNVFLSLRSVSSDRSRLRLALGLLETSLKTHAEELKKLVDKTARKQSI